MEQAQDARTGVGAQDEAHEARQDIFDAVFLFQDGFQGSGVLGAVAVGDGDQILVLRAASSPK